MVMRDYILHNPLTGVLCSHADKKVKKNRVYFLQIIYQSFLILIRSLGNSTAQLGSV